MARLSAHDFLMSIGNIPLLDVRSPSEYQSGHIPGAVSFPLFSDDERAVIGTLYKQQGRNPAIKKGLEIVGPKMVHFIEQAEAFQSTHLNLYCWRGGMRSESMAWLLERYGFTTTVLAGGYKAYRSHALNFFEQPLPLKVVSGYTGSKKTHFLQMLKEAGEQVIDLEGLAQHQGSSFGNKKSTGQPTTEQFQNLLYQEFSVLDMSKVIWIEDESMRIGQVNLPQRLYQRMEESPRVVLDISLAERVEFLVQDYGLLSKEQLISATEAIQKKLGRERAAEAIEYIRNGALKEAATIILTYYDAWYEKSLSKKKERVEERYTISMNDLPALAIKLAKEKTHAV